MTCREAIYSENVLDYLVNTYGGAEGILERYDPLCVEEIDNSRAVIYRQEEKINSESIGQFGYGAIPHVYGLMGEEALEAAGVLKIRRQPYLDLYGQNILIGVVDTGIEFTHKAFINADNTTRIRSIWDQTIREGEDVEGFRYGREFLAEEINAALADDEPQSMIPTRDDNGHGTLLAGVAAGNELPEDDFSGVAPLSQLVVVKCKEAKNSYREFYRVPQSVPCYQENDIMAGIAYILRVAQNEGKPVAICLGMGTNQGNHNGESPLCNMIDYFNSLPGVCIVTCAGNEGNARHHYSITKEYEEIDIQVDADSLGFVAELWWRTPGTLQFDVVSPGGNTLGITRASSFLRERKLFVLEDTTLEVLGSEVQEQGRDQVAVFRFENSKAGIWKIRVYTMGDVKYHMWLPIREFLAEETYFVRPDPDVTVCEPGNSRRGITMTAYNPVDEALYLQASRGFSANGFIKPDVTAPGVNVSGPMPRNRIGMMTGTSVAVAVTTGVAALFMQQYEEEFLVSGNAVRELLIRGAEPRGEEYPNREWGYGTIDAYESISFE